MTDTAHLARPNAAVRASYLDALREGYAVGGSIPLAPDTIAAIERDFPAHLKSLDRDGQTLHVDGGHALPGVPSNMFWLIDGGAFVGGISIRARIDTNALINVGGHIGYGIRPAMRGRGYGKRQLALGLDIARGMGIGLVRISCRESNHASRRIIEANGGLFIRRNEHRLVDEPMLLFEIPLV